MFDYCSSRVVALPRSCGNPDGSCEHYEQCVEPLLQCGEYGFTLAFGRPHCEIIGQLPSNMSIPSWMLEWLRSHEMCLQQKVYELATAQQCSTPDPVGCLKFEASALVAFEECFTRNVSLLCDSSELSENPTMLADQVSTLAQLLGIDDYYRHWILEAVTRAVNTSCVHPNTTHVVSSVRPPSSNRIVFCAIVSGDTSDANSFAVSSYVERIANQLGQSVEQFEYVGNYDGRIQELCRENAPPALGNVFHNSVFHYVMWEPASEDALLNSVNQYYFQPVTSNTFFDFYALDSLRSYGLCGDGIRQAGEFCDMGVKNFFGVQGCNTSCMPCDEYECDTERLVESMCHPTVCGDGRRTSNEECDDGNVITGDGCTNCRNEEGYVCTGPYNGTSSCLQGTTQPPPSTITTATSSSSQSTVTDISTTRTGDTTPPLRPVVIDGSATSLNCFSYSILFTIHLK